MAEGTGHANTGKVWGLFRYRSKAQRRLVCDESAAAPFEHAPPPTALGALYRAVPSDPTSGLTSGPRWSTPVDGPRVSMGDSVRQAKFS